MENLYLRCLRLAQTINHLHGGAVVSFWDVAEMDDETGDFFLAMAYQFPEMRQHYAELERQRMAWLNGHPQYREFGLLAGGGNA